MRLVGVSDMRFVDKFRRLEASVSSELQFNLLDMRKETNKRLGLSLLCWHNFEHNR